MSTSQPVALILELQWAMPAHRLGCRVPLSRARLHHFVTVDDTMPLRSATSCRVMPSATCATTRSRRSSE